MTSQADIPWPHWVLRAIASGDRAAYEDAIWSVGGSPPWGGVPYEEAEAVYNLLEEYLGPGMASAKAYEQAKLKTASERQAALELFGLNDRVTSNPDTYDADVVARGLALSSQVGHEGMLGTFLAYQSGLANRNHHLPEATEANWQALQIFLRLADGDPAYALRAAQCSTNAVAYRAQSSDEDAARKLQEQLKPVLAGFDPTEGDVRAPDSQGSPALATRNQPARYYFDAHHACAAAWAGSGYKDRSALDDLAPTLAVWLSDYPGHADQIQQLAISDCYTTAAFQLYDLVEGTARVGLDAALIRPERSPADKQVTALLTLLLAEALLEQDQAAECQQTLDYGRTQMAALDAAGPFRAYLELHLSSLAGVFSHAMLEHGTAAEHYRQAAEYGIPLLEDPVQMQQLVATWTPLVYGSGPDLVQDGAASSAFILERDVRSACHRAILGLAATAQDRKVEAAGQAVAFVRRHGLPPRGNPVELRPALLALPFAELETCLPDLLVLADEFRRQWDDSAWQVLLHVTAAAHPGAPRKFAGQSLDAAAAALDACSDALTLAVAAGDLMSARLHRRHPAAGSKAYAETIDSIWMFARVAAAASDSLAGSARHLPFKALLDEPIGRAVEWLFDCGPEQAEIEGSLLSVLLDALRTREQQIPPSDFKIGSVEQGLVNALNRLGRLGVVVKRAGDTAAILLQTAGEDTLFFCPTGEYAEPLMCERAGPEYGAAARRLASVLRASFGVPGEEPARGVRGPQAAPFSISQALEDAGKAAYNALPERVRELISRRHVLYWAPDFRSDQEGVPFELFHDGAATLGLSKVIVRALSLRELLWTLEPPVLRPHDPSRSLVVAAPNVEGFPELVYASQEAGEVRAGLIAAGLESPELDESQVDGVTLLHACEKAAVVHVASHGIRYAGGEALVLPRGERLLASDIERKPQFLRAFTYLNTCSLGQSRYLGGGVSRGIAYALLRQRAPAVVANLLPVYDRSSARLSAEFYKEARSAPVGEALRRARAKVAGEGASPAHWGCTVLTGNPGHVLPGTRISPAPPKRKRDTAARLLDAYSDPHTGREQQEAAFRAAVSELSGGGHPRLLAAMSWVEGAATVDPAQPADPDTIERLAALAHEIGHPVGEALMRFQLAVRPPEDRSPAERLADLDAAIRALEPVRGYDEVWSNVLTECLAARQRLIAPQEPQAFNLGGMRINDQSDPAIAGFYQLQRAFDQEDIRRGRSAVLRRPEVTLEDVTWNAVVIGQENRFRSAGAHLDLATSLAEKLCLKGLIPEAGQDHARRILAGLLPYLWSAQRIIHLDRELAVGQAGTLALALRSIAANWVPPVSSPAYPLVADLPGRLDAAVEARERAGLSRYALALRAITSDAGQQDELAALGQSLRGIIEAARTLTPQAGADCAAWIAGLLLERRCALARGSEAQAAAAEDLQRPADDLAHDMEEWYIPYLMDGFASVRSAGLSILDLWN